MFGLEPDSLSLGAGIFAFDSERLMHWRERIDSLKGVEVQQLLSELASSGVRLSDPELKRVPAPYSQEHPRGTELRRKGLTAWIDKTDPAFAFGPNGAARCVDILIRLRPLVGILAELDKT